MDRIWATVEPTVFVTRREYEHALRDWTVRGYEFDGRLSFATLVNGPEFHICMLRPDYNFTTRVVASLFRPILRQFGYLVTRTPKNETRQIRFNKAAGFREIGEDEFFFHYRMEAEGSRWLR